MFNDWAAAEGLDYFTCNGALIMSVDKKIRVLAAKPGLDGHDRGIKVVASALMDAGMEVIYTGLRQTPRQIVEAAVQEDVDVIAMSILSGAHDYLFPKVMELLKDRGVEDILVIGGGIIPDEDVPALKACGIAEIFGPGTNTQDIVGFIKSSIKRKSI
jgi:methylmalonyl-CoA mutase C-terminal domain/subunit